jgi:hypothetical protein
MRRGGFEYRKVLFVYKVGEIKLRGRKFIYQTKCNAHLLMRNIFDNTSLRITNNSRGRMLTKLVYVRCEVLTAVLTIQVFRDVTPCHWVSPRVSKNRLSTFRVTWPGTATHDVYYSAKSTKQTNKQTKEQKQEPFRSP